MQRMRLKTHMKPNRPINSSEILTTGQIARMCSVDSRTVKRWIKEGILNAHELPMTGISRVRITDFLLFLKNNKLPVPDTMKYLIRDRVLVVDDDECVLSSIRRILTYPDSDDLVICEASDGFEAGRILADFKPDLIILDILMPRMDGLSMLRQIKSNPETRGIKVLVISGLITNGDRQKMTDFGADDLLAKPLDEYVFKSKVFQLLKRDYPHG